MANREWDGGAGLPKSLFPIRYSYKPSNKSLQLQRQLQPEAVFFVVQLEVTELFDPLEPIADRISMKVENLGRPAEVTVRGKKCLKRRHEITPVSLVVLHDYAKRLFEEAAELGRSVQVEEQSIDP